MNTKLITTNYGKGLYWAETTPAVGGVDYLHTLNLFPHKRYQTFHGFGGAFTESSGYNLSLLSAEKQREVIDACFSSQGLRYTQGRIHLGSCDFALGNYCAVTDAADAELSTFTLERDREYILPMLQMAMARCEQPLEIMASPWSPPAFMKTNEEMNHGGALRPEYAGRWARLLAKYVKAYRAEGVPVTRLTVQNEPAAAQGWDSCLYTGAEEADFVRIHLAPALEKEGLGDLKILIWDHNKDVVYQRARESLEDPAAARLIDGIAFHWYGGDHFEALAMVREDWPDKELWFSEGCVEYSRFSPDDAMGMAEMYAHDIIGNLNAGTNGSIDWNLLLDMQGGPNHAGNFCDGPLMCSPEEDRVEKRLTYHYLGQLSRYIRPGAVRIGLSRYSMEAEATAFLNLDGSRVVCILNRGENPLPLSVRERWDEAVNFTLEPHSIATLLIE